MWSLYSSTVLDNSFLHPLKQKQQSYRIPTFLNCIKYSDYLLRARKYSHTLETFFKSCMVHIYDSSIYKITLRKMRCDNSRRHLKQMLMGMIRTDVHNKRTSDYTFLAEFLLFNGWAVKPHLRNFSEYITSINRKEKMRKASGMCVKIYN